jgi:probable F420-dependent oxidoreductase
MKYGLCERFDGPGKDLAYVGGLAQTVEGLGFDSLWMPDHLAFFDRIESRYPYASSGVPPVPGNPGFPDPYVMLALVGAATRRLLLGTAVLILPQRHPLLTARQSATLDRITGGRFILGVGVGWLREEYDALGVPWERRGERCAEYIDAVKSLWTTDRSTYVGSTVAFQNAISYPKPARDPHPPVYVGGNSSAALRRAAHQGDGWFGWGLELSEIEDRQDRLRTLLDAVGRDPGELVIQVGLQHFGSPDDLVPYTRGLERLGVDRLVIASPLTSDGYISQLERLAEALNVSADPA